MIISVAIEVISQPSPSPPLLPNHVAAYLSRAVNPDVGSHYGGPGVELHVLIEHGGVELGWHAGVGVVSPLAAGGSGGEDRGGSQPQRGEGKAGEAS